MSKTRDKHHLPLEIRTTKVDQIVQEFADACGRLFSDACRKFLEKTVADGEPASGHIV